MSYSFFRSLCFQDTSLLSRAANFSKVDYLIIHGSGDGKFKFLCWIAAEILARSLAYFNCQEADRHEFIVYAMLQRARADNSVDNL